MKRNRRSDCPINFSLETFGDMWSLLIIRDIVYFGKRTYGEFRSSEEGIATNILGSRLAHLVQQGILVKRPYDTDRRKDEYALTEKGLDLIVVDYLQLMTTSKNYDSMVNQVTEISRSLKALAKELDVPVLALSQLSRAIEARGGKPRLSDLRDSGSIEQDADVVMFIHHEDRGKEESERTNIAEILIEKHRNGPTGKIELHFDEKTTTFLTLEKSALSDFAPAKISGDLDEF